MCQVQVNGKAVEMMVDTGASVNLLDEATFHRIDCGNKLLEHAHSKIYSYGSDTPLPLLGTLSTTIKSSSNSTNTQLHVKGNTGNLLSYNTARMLGLTAISVNTTTVTDVNKDSPESLQEEFECLYGGIGRLRNKIVKLHVDPDITLRQQPHRWIPFHVRGDARKELERLERLDIIERVERPTPWISPIVVVPKKSGEVRICVDMPEANKAVKREKHLTPTIDDLIADLNGATNFSTLDLSSGYHQLELAPESRFVTTFSTHVGLRRYKRLPFGINAASKIFQVSIKELLTGLPGCKNISDDIIVFGKGKDEHDKNLRGVLQRLKDNNKDKCEFSKKVEAIRNASPTQNASDIKSLLGMTQYVSRFIPNYATITAPLRLSFPRDKTLVAVTSL